MDNPWRGFKLAVPSLQARQGTDPTRGLQHRAEAWQAGSAVGV